MNFLRRIDLNTICRTLEWIAVITFVLGIIGSIHLGVQSVKIEKYYSQHEETIINWTIIITGLTVTFLNSVFLLFLSRIGDAIDDIQNKYLGLDELNDEE